MQKLLKVSSALFLALTLGACAFPGVFQIDVQQGNIVDHEDLDRLVPTMTRSDVHQLLGTPIVVSSFDTNREHYIYTFQRSGGEIKRQRITIFYEDNRYLRHEASLLPDTPAN